MKFVNVKEINKYFNSNDLLELINKEGVGEIKFLVPMSKVMNFGFIRYTSPTDKKDSVVCTISEERYKVEDKYKITLVAENYDLYGCEHYYTSDLAALIKDDYIRIIQCN